MSKKLEPCPFCGNIGLVLCCKVIYKIWKIRLREMWFKGNRRVK